MTATFEAAGERREPTAVQRLWQRQLEHYPDNGPRFLSLGIVVATTVVLYYQLYLAGGVGVQILGDLHMSFLYFVNISVIGYAFGALASVLAGLADRYGRANIVTAGLGLTGILSLAVLPQVHSELGFAITYIAIGFVEGIVLVATPALIRDFSPQLGRASAMGGWTLGPVLGSLVVSVIITNTSGHSWQWQYGLAGIIGLVVFVIAALGLRELSPNLRDQLMVSQKDRVLIEARAKGLDIESTLHKPFRQMLHLDVVGSAFAISVFLIIYYVAVGFFPIFFETVFNYTVSQANALGNYFWAFDAGALLLVGIISDLVRVRKPFMVIGAIGAIVFTSIFAVVTTHTPAKNPNDFTSKTTFILLLIGISVSLGIAFAPWMASFTETVERRNPALTATGLAVWGLVIRVVIAVTVVFLPHVVNTVSTVVDKGGQIQKYEADPTPIQTAAGPTTVGAVATAAATPSNAPVLAKVKVIATRDAALLGAFQKNPAVAKALAAAQAAGVTPTAAQLGQIKAALGDQAFGELISPTTPADLAYLGATAPKALGPANFAALSALGTPAGNPQLTTAITYLTENGPAVVEAQGKSAKQWQKYFFLGVAGQIVFIPLVFLMAGFWSPRKAREAEKEHEAMVATEMAKLQEA